MINGWRNSEVFEWTYFFNKKKTIIPILRYCQNQTIIYILCNYNKFNDVKKFEKIIIKVHGNIRIDFFIRIKKKTIFHRQIHWKI